MLPCKTLQAPFACFSDPDIEALQQLTKVFNCATKESDPMPKPRMMPVTTLWTTVRPMPTHQYPTQSHVPGQMTPEEPPC